MKMYIALYRAHAVRDAQICKLNQDFIPGEVWDDANWEDAEWAEVYIGTFTAESEDEAIEKVTKQEGCDKSAVRVIEVPLPEVSKRPYTLEEMRHLGGKPYYHVGLQKDSPAPHWAILDPHFAAHPEDYHYGEYWLAYGCEV